MTCRNDMAHRPWIGLHKVIILHQEPPNGLSNGNTQWWEDYLVGTDCLAER